MMMMMTLMMMLIVVVVVVAVVMMMMIINDEAYDNDNSKFCISAGHNYNGINDLLFDFTADLGCNNIFLTCVHHAHRHILTQVSQFLLKMA